MYSPTLDTWFCLFVHISPIWQKLPVVLTQRSLDDEYMSFVKKNMDGDFAEFHNGG